MLVELCHFPETKVAVIEHLGAPGSEKHTLQKLVDWRVENNLKRCPSHQSYGVHFNDPTTVSPNEYRVDFCLSVVNDILPNKYNVIAKTIPKCRCAKLRHIGSRESISSAHYLYNVWLKDSNEELGDFPMFFHYIDIGADLNENELITDIYLPLKYI